MKKKIFYLSAVICLVSLLTSARQAGLRCERDDCPRAVRDASIRAAASDQPVADTPNNESRLIIKSNP